MNSDSQTLTEAVRKRADQAVEAVGESLSNAGAQLWENGPDALGTAAAGLESAGEYLADRDLQQLTNDVTGFVRKHPLPCVALGLAAGGLLGLVLARLKGGRRA